ncbi:MAG: toxic anion resistance protein [Bacillota bacterium]
MALNFDKPAEAPTSAPATGGAVVIDDVKDFDISKDRNALAETFVNSEEIEALTNEIVVSDMNTIVTFGGEVAENISRASDVVLNSMSMSKIDESSKMLTILAKVMDKFDIDEIKEKEGNVFTKLFNSARKQLDAILDKYQTMGQEVDKIYIELKSYETEIIATNRNLETMFQSNVEFYHELVKYILAGEQGAKEIGEYIEQRQADLQNTGDSSIQFELTSLEQAKMMLEQRTQDLRIAENVAMQSIPMIKTMQFSNVNLIRKINSAFIITLPIFKQSLAQAIMLKRQKIQAEAMSALDKKTNEMLIKNANNTVEQSKMIAQMSSGSSIKMETLEETWKTIMTGIQETKAIQDNAKIQREQDQQRLNAIKEDFKTQYGTQKLLEK